MWDVCISNTLLIWIVYKRYYCISLECTYALYMEYGHIRVCNLFLYFKKLIFFYQMFPDITYINPTKPMNSYLSRNPWKLPTKRGYFLISIYYFSSPLATCTWSFCILWSHKQEISHYQTPHPISHETIKNCTNDISHFDGNSLALYFLIGIFFLALPDHKNAQTFSLPTLKPSLLSTPCYHCLPLSGCKSQSSFVWHGWVCWSDVFCVQRPRGHKQYSCGVMMYLYGDGFDVPTKLNNSVISI